MEYNINNVTITKIYKSTKDKNERPYVSKKGNPFTKVDIYVDPQEADIAGFDGKMSMFDYFDKSANWNTGTKISGILIQNGNYWNFSLPVDGVKGDVNKIKADIEDLQRRVSDLEEGGVQAPRDTVVVAEDDDLPF